MGEGDDLHNRLFNKVRAPRGELWISGEVLAARGLELKQLCLVDLCLEAGMDICFFGYNNPYQVLQPGGGEMPMLVKRAHSRGLVCGVTIDGPFERLVGEQGFTATMKLFYKENGLKEGLARHAGAAAMEIADACEAGADLLLLCDDMAYGQGMYFSPAHFERFILPCYSMFRGVAAKGSVLGFHCDGNPGIAVDGLSKEGYGVFSLEPECVDIEGISAGLPGGAFLISGIRSRWISGPVQQDGALESELRRLVYLAWEKRLVFASCCGIADASSLDRLEDIYAVIDRHSSRRGGSPDALP